MVITAVFLYRCGATEERLRGLQKHPCRWWQGLSYRESYTMGIAFRLRCPKYTCYFRYMSTRWCVRVCGCVDERRRRREGRREGGKQGSRERGRDGGQKPQRSSSAHTCHPRLAEEMLGWHGTWMQDRLGLGGFWPPERKLTRQPGAFTAAGSYSLGFLPGLSLEKTWFRIMNGPELDIFKVEGL